MARGAARGRVPTAAGPPGSPERNIAWAALRRGLEWRDCRNGETVSLYTASEYSAPFTPNREMMNRENIAGLLAGIIGLLVFAFAFFYGPLITKNPPPKQTKIEAPPKAPEAPVRGPAVRDITPNK
jgi:hypothetical protein